MTLKELKDKRAELIAKARKIWDQADSEKRDLSAEERGEAENMLNEADKLEKDIEQRERLEKHENWAKSSQGRKTEPGDPASQPAAEKKAADEVRTVTWGEKFAFPRAIRLGGPRATGEFRTAFARWLGYGYQSPALAPAMITDEERALQADLDTAGGYLNAPQEMIMELIQAVDNLVFIRQKARVFTVNSSNGLGVPSLDTDMADADWTSELGTGNEDSSLAFGKRELKPHPLAKRIKVSNTLLRTAAIGPEAIVRERLAYKFGVAQETAFMTGSGAGQPLGIFTASSQGISTSRDVSTDNTMTAITADNLINVKYSLKAQYQRTAEWVFHRDAVKMIRKLKDGNGQYLWQPGLGGTPDTLLDRPVNISEYAPNTFTTGMYVGILGDFRFYWIADVIGLQVQRLVELYAATNQTGFIGRLETDGAPVLEEAFARVKLA